jgi:hypothetical protein
MYRIDVGSLDLAAKNVDFPGPWRDFQLQI